MLATLQCDRTTVVVAHRLSTIVGADDIAGTYCYEKKAINIQYTHIPLGYNIHIQK